MSAKRGVDVDEGVCSVGVLLLVWSKCLRCRFWMISACASLSNLPYIWSLLICRLVGWLNRYSLHLFNASPWNLCIPSQCLWCSLRPMYLQFVVILFINMIWCFFLFSSKRFSSAFFQCGIGIHANWMGYVCRKCLEWNHDPKGTISILRRLSTQREWRRISNPPNSWAETCCISRADWDGVTLGRLRSARIKVERSGRSYSLTP